MQGFRFRAEVYGSELMGYFLEFRVNGLGCRVYGIGFMVTGLESRGVGCRV